MEEVLVPERVAGAPQVQESWSSKGPGGKQVESILRVIATVKNKESLEIMWSSLLLADESNLSNSENILPLGMKAYKTPLGCLQNQCLNLK